MMVSPLCFFKLLALTATLEQRYTCVQLGCLPEANTAPTYYPTWTALQHHIRTAHPPECTHPSCNGRIFASQKGLRAHQKLHEQRDLEEEMVVSDAEDTHDMQPPRKKRRGGEIGRDWKCSVDDCQKDFKSKKALDIHTKVTHLGRRDHVCPHDGCEQTYGYKHLLQRHLAKAHKTISADDDFDESDSAGRVKSPRKKANSTSLDIDTITGHSYAQRTRANVENATALLCPYPHLETISIIAEDDIPASTAQTSASHACDYSFSRGYDFRRHLKSAHGMNAMKESIDKWVSRQKCARRLATQSMLYSPPSATTHYT
ncbi:hypothetical protein H0H87_004147 [Tephrocybe sp. NHM501043]|nr:hypothetical protein H0H87_004147 [Tephrocybe sp. NHM501043]